MNVTALAIIVMECLWVWVLIYGTRRGIFDGPPAVIPGVHGAKSGWHVIRGHAGYRCLRLIAHRIDWTMSSISMVFLLGLGGITGAQIGARLLADVPVDVFKKILAVLLIGLAIYLFVKK